MFPSLTKTVPAVGAIFINLLEILLISISSMLVKMKATLIPVTMLPITVLNRLTIHTSATHQFHHHLSLDKMIVIVTKAPILIRLEGT
jgi:hypothetical protein